MYQKILLCFGKDCCVSGNFLVFWKRLLWSRIDCRVLENIVVFWKRLLCFRTEIELCFAPMGHRTHALYLKRRQWPPIFFAFLAQVTHYLTAVKILKKSIEWKIFARTSLKWSRKLTAVWKVIEVIFLMSWSPGNFWCCYSWLYHNNSWAVQSSTVTG